MIQYQICRNNLNGVRDVTVYPYGLWDKSAKVTFDNSYPGKSGIIELPAHEEDFDYIKTARIDDIIKEERSGATFIKMNVEGAELNALKGAKHVIEDFHPKLAICVYHILEDIWEVPSYILSLNGDYRMHIRHYSLFEFETVLYAV